MAIQVNVYEAKSRLSQLLAQVEAGEEVVIARNGAPVARLVSVRRDRGARTPGAWRGKVWMAPDFDLTDEELARLMEDGPIFPEQPDSR
ncbi:MAG: type II toxin-antitoxin system prevent-host-death family antitoxin [Actinomycetota bacterium]|nr:type II toxin-antitoxin system prevent-host-death family antitoxin [Actinomycetota bacterium]